MQQRSSPEQRSSGRQPGQTCGIASADGQHMIVSFSDVRNFICAKATDAECKIFLRPASSIG